MMDSSGLKNDCLDCKKCKGDTVRRYGVKLISPNGTPVRVYVCKKVYHILTDKD